MAHQCQIIHVYGKDESEGSGGIPGTTPLVAIALIDIAVNIVCRGTERQTDFSEFKEF